MINPMLLLQKTIVSLGSRKKNIKSLNASKPGVGGGMGQQFVGHSPLVIFSCSKPFFWLNEGPTHILFVY